MSIFFVQPTGWLKNVFLFPYFILIIAGLIIPSDGSHGIINIKALAYVATVCSVGCYAVMVKKANTSQLNMVCFLLGSLLFLLVWLSISMLRDTTPLNSAWDQFKIFWLTISFVIISSYLFKENLISFEKLLKIAIYANFAYSLAKVVMVILLVLGFFDMLGTMAQWGFRFMSMDITGKIPRFQTSMDIATPFLLFFFLKGDRFGITWSKKFRVFYLLISWCAILLSFSRFLAFVGIISLLLHAFSERNSLSVLMRSFAIFLFCVLIGVTWIGVDQSYAIIEKRLYSKANYTSDLVRQQQISALLEEYEEAPFIGKGLGSYAPKMIRDKQLRYSYEVQWIAFLMQFGVVGIACFLAALGLVAIKILSVPWTRQKIALFALFLVWLASGFTNPFLISLSSGIMYTLFFLGGYELSEKAKEVSAF